MVSIRSSDLERAWQIVAPPTIRYSDHFLYAFIILRASPRVRYPEFGGCLLFGCCNCIIIYGDISWYIEQRPLFGRRLLLGVSVNKESTVNQKGGSVSGCHAENINPHFSTDFLLSLPTQEDC